VARTDPTLPKHQGLSMFIVPMDTPGIEVRPLILLTGEHSFNEVFCTDVRIPETNLVGEINGGWRAAIAMLMNERVALGASGNSLVSGRADVLIDAARRAGRADDPVLRQELADMHIREEVLRYVALRVRAAMDAGRSPGPEGSIAKLAGSELVKRAAHVAGRIEGAGLAAFASDDDAAEKTLRSVLSAPSLSIAGGTTEIQRNIIAERVLGLPKER
jgi:alkylation response protein AidB-like acyl-CoA dehydrogenase